MNIYKIFNLIFLISFFLLISKTQLLYSQQISVIDSLKIEYKTQNNFKLKYETAIVLYTYYKNIKQNDSALCYLTKSEIDAENNKNQNLAANSIYLKGSFFMEQNEFLKASEYFLDALSKAEQSKDSNLICIISNELGVSFRRLDDDVNSLKYHIKSLEYAELLNNRQQQAKALNSIGILYNLSNNYENAIIQFELAKKIEEERENWVGVAINYNTIAWTYELEKNYKKAIEYYNKAISVNKKIKNLQGIAICLNDIGKVYLIQKDTKKADAFLHESMEIFVKIKDTRNLAYTQINIAKLYYLTQQYSLVIKYAKDALQYAEKSFALRMMLDCNELLAQTYEKTGYFAYAIDYYKIYIELNNKIYEESNKKLLTETKIKFEYRQKEQQVKLISEKKRLLEQTIFKQKIIGIIGAALFLVSLMFGVFFFISRQKQQKANVLLKNQKEEINTQKETLENQKLKLEELHVSKDKFFSIIAHDLRNPFSALISLTALIIEDYNENTDEERKEMIGLVHESAETGHRLLENLLSWAKSQSNGIKIVLEQFSINDIFFDATESMLQILKNKKISLINLIENEDIVFADKNMIITVLRNLISNSAKFTNENGKITVNSYYDNNYTVINIADNGIGMPAKVIEKIFILGENQSRKGTNSEQGSGLGLILCKEFIEKNGGKLLLKSEVNIGTEFFIYLPRFSK